MKANDIIRILPSQEVYVLFAFLTIHHPTGESPVLLGCIVKFLCLFCLRRQRAKTANQPMPRFHRVTRSGAGMQRVFYWQSPITSYVPSAAAAASRLGRPYYRSALPRTRHSWRGNGGLCSGDSAARGTHVIHR